MKKMTNLRHFWLITIEFDYSRFNWLNEITLEIIICSFSHIGKKKAPAPPPRTVSALSNDVTLQKLNETLITTDSNCEDGEYEKL